LSTNCGSVESLKKSCTWGLSSNCRQIRPIVDLLSPVRAAIEARDQCVALGGVCSSVAITTSSTWSSRIEGGRPGRGSSTSPSSRWATNRPRQRVTVPGVTRNRAATSVFDRPSAQASTIFALWVPETARTARGLLVRPRS